MEEVSMDHFWEEAGQTVRTAITSTPATVRLCVILIVAAIITTWFLMVVPVGG